jgi:23S rRNA (guanosine2251-2'-O)-methyltransferase
VTNIAQTIERLKREGIWTVAAVGGAERTIHDIDLTVPVALVIGNEHKGIGRLVRETCDLEAGIPMYGRIASLNASVAAGIMMYEAVRQRRLR